MPAFTGSSTTSQTPAGSFASKAVTVLGLATVLLLSGPAAQAHDVIEATSLAEGSTVRSVPAAVVLTFGRAPVAVGTKINVNDWSGADQADGDPNVGNDQVTQAIKPGAPAGTYKVAWRVVSSDAHPIEGTFTFTAGAPGGRTVTSPAGAAGGATASTALAPSTSEPSDEAMMPDEAEGGSISPWALAAGALALVTLTALWKRAR